MTREMKTKTRSERRMERKQAGLLLVTMLAVSLVSFSLGVMVGKSGSPQTTSVSTVPAASESVVVGKQQPGSAGESAEKKAATEDDEQKAPLTFFDTLPKSDEPPLGSGINRAPAETERADPQKELEAALDEARQKSEQAPASGTAREVQQVEAEAPQAASDAEGRFVVQVGSFRASADARALKERLVQKGFAAFIEQADLGEKGVWHRVRVGPFAEAESARSTVDLLKAQEKIDGFVTRR